MVEYEIETLRMIRDGNLPDEPSAARHEAFAFLAGGGYVKNGVLTEKGYKLLDDIDHIEIIEDADVEDIITPKEWAGVGVAALLLVGALATLVLLGVVVP